MEIKTKRDYSLLWLFTGHLHEHATATRTWRCRCVDRTEWLYLQCHTWHHSACPAGTSILHASSCNFSKAPADFFRTKHLVSFIFITHWLTHKYTKHWCFTDEWNKRNYPFSEMNSGALQMRGHQLVRIPTEGPCSVNHCFLVNFYIFPIL